MTELSVFEVTQQLAEHHHRQADLCLRLEEIADSLPDDVNNQTCLCLARQVFPTVREAHEFEEKVLFPMLNKLAASTQGLDHSLERLRFEHWEDESFAEELRDELREFVHHNDKRNSEKLGYMLRGFFEGLRRHMAFETEHLLPILKGQIGSEAVA